MYTVEYYSVLKSKKASLGYIIRPCFKKKKNQPGPSGSHLDCSSSTARANSMRNSISKITRARWIGDLAQVVDMQAGNPEFKP
jgi:hypothetical protein